MKWKVFFLRISATAAGKAVIKTRFKNGVVYISDGKFYPIIGGATP